MTKSSRFIEYMKVHLISLEQDYDMLPDGDRDSVIHLNGQVLATKHLLSVATDIMEQNGIKDMEYANE
jgi:hypothetical protein